MFKVLIADDEANIRKVLSEYAKHKGYVVFEACDGNEALQVIRDEHIDIVIMDIMMPRLDGFSAIKQIRNFRSDLPIIILSARGEEYDKLLGFEIGADDYVSKPFSPSEVFARIAAILKRAGDKTDIFRLDGLEIDFLGRNVFVDDKKVELTQKEFDLLGIMVQSRGTVLSRDKLLSKVWGYDYYGEDRTLDTHIKTLRSALGSYRNHIITVRGVGYKFEKK